MKLIAKILSFKGVKIVLYNLIAVILCRYYLFSVIDIERFRSVMGVDDFIMKFVIGYLIVSNIYFFFGEFRKWVWTNIVIEIPFIVVGILKWILVSWKFVDIYAAAKIQVNVLNMIPNSYEINWYWITYFCVAAIVTACVVKNKKKEEGDLPKTSWQQEQKKYIDKKTYVFNINITAILYIIGFIIVIGGLFGVCAWSEQNHDKNHVRVNGHCVDKVEYEAQQAAIKNCANPIALTVPVCPANVEKEPVNITAESYDVSETNSITVSVVNGKIKVINDEVN
jgi:hypothetical protein